MTGTDELRAQYRALVETCGAFVLSRDVLRVHGPDAASYLQGQCSQDVAGLPAGEHTDALLLAPEGKIDALVRVTRVAEEDFLVDVEGGFGDAVVRRLGRFKLRAKFDIDPLEWHCTAVRGPSSASAVEYPEDAPLTAGVMLSVAWNDWSGIDILGPSPEHAVVAGTPIVGPDAWEARRIEAGVPVLGHELDERTIAAEAGLVERTVSFTKGCFTGQELVARLDARGNKVARHLVGIEIPGVDAGAVPEGAELSAPGADKVLGALTSVGWSPRIDGVVALGYMHRTAEVPGPVLVRTAATTEPIAATARPLPLA